VVRLVVTTQAGGWNTLSSKRHEVVQEYMLGENVLGENELWVPSEHTFRGGGAKTILGTRRPLHRERAWLPSFRHFCQRHHFHP
jgi:hypothetical protein